MQSGVGEHQNPTHYNEVNKKSFEYMAQICPFCRYPSTKHYYMHSMYEVKDR